MLESTPRWLAFEAEDERATWESQSHAEALRRFAALWAWAREVNPALGQDWLDDLGADFAVARAINGLPPA